MNKCQLETGWISGEDGVGYQHGIKHCRIGIISHTACMVCMARTGGNLPTLLLNNAIFLVFYSIDDLSIRIRVQNNLILIN